MTPPITESMVAHILAGQRVRRVTHDGEGRTRIELAVLGAPEPIVVEGVIADGNGRIRPGWTLRNVIFTDEPVTAFTFASPAFKKLVTLRMWSLSWTVLCPALNDGEPWHPETRRRYSDHIADTQG